MATGRFGHDATIPDIGNLRNAGQKELIQQLASDAGAEHGDDIFAGEASPEMALIIKAP
jgi:hypothetical protein